MPHFIPVQSFSCSIFILRETGIETQVLLMRRTGTLAGTWCHVAGGIEAGESAWQTAVRETREETGLTLSSLWSADVLEQFYEVDKECITVVPVFVGFVPPDAQVFLNSEHDAFQWLPFDEAAKLYSFPGQRKALAAVKEEFIDRTPNPHLKIEMETGRG